MAIREDEDVAEALGVNLVQTKIAGLHAGRRVRGPGRRDLRVARSGSVFPSSINFYVSINVVAIVIVGGMGSIPGVVVGAIVLIGLPELFREFSEYRFLFYGIVLMVMMRFRPEGLCRRGSADVRCMVADGDPLGGPTARRDDGGRG